jgi:hypothetical protein
MNIFRILCCRNNLLPGLFFFLNSIAWSQESTQGSSAGNFEIISYNHCELAIKSFTGNTVSLVYNTLPANQAGLNHNSLWLWRSSEVPWRYRPQKKKLLPINATQSGSYVLEDVTVTIGATYIACYSVDSTVKQICACAVLGAVIDSTKNNWVDIALLDVAANSLTFKYTTLPGYLPAVYNNWFGLWEGAASPYNPFPSLASGKPTGNSNTSTAGLNGLKLESGQLYTLIYFTGKSNNQAAAMITFRVK